MQHRATWIVLGGLVVVAAAAVLLVPRHEVIGTEFSPDLFAHRSFRYQEHAWFGFQVSPVETREFRSPLDEYLHHKNFVRKLNGEQPRWLLVKGFRRGVRGWSGEAKDMCQALGCFSGRSETWITWSENHPECAEKLWPIVVNCARNEQFGKISRIMYFVRDYPDVACDHVQQFIEFAMQDDAW